MAGTWGYGKPTEFPVFVGMELGAQAILKLYFSLKSAGPSGLTTKPPQEGLPHPGPHLSRPREAPTWASASPGAFQSGVSTSWAAAVSGSGSSTSAMGSGDDPGKTLAIGLGKVAPRRLVASLPACARPAAR